jgi:hypothetical protein
MSWAVTGPERRTPQSRRARHSEVGRTRETRHLPTILAPVMTTPWCGGHPGSVWPFSAYPSVRQSEGPQPTSKLEIIQSWACITEPLLVGNPADRVGPVALRPRIAPGLPLPMSDPMAELNDIQLIYSRLTELTWMPPTPNRASTRSHQRPPGQEVALDISASLLILEAWSLPI